MAGTGSGTAEQYIAEHIDAVRWYDCHACDHIAPDNENMKKFGTQGTAAFKRIALPVARRGITTPFEKAAWYQRMYLVRLLTAHSMLPKPKIADFVKFLFHSRGMWVGILILWCIGLILILSIYFAVVVPLEKRAEGLRPAICVLDLASIEVTPDGVCGKNDAKFCFDLEFAITVTPDDASIQAFTYREEEFCSNDDSDDEDPSDCIQETIDKYNAGGVNAGEVCYYEEEHPEKAYENDSPTAFGDKYVASQIGGYLFGSFALIGGMIMLGVQIFAEARPQYREMRACYDSQQGNAPPPADPYKQIRAYTQGAVAGGSGVVLESNVGIGVGNNLQNVTDMRNFATADKATGEGKMQREMTHAMPTPATMASSTGSMYGGATAPSAPPRIHTQAHTQARQTNVGGTQPQLPSY